uniref:Uncharacterized protein n=1 Tax=Anguilla anguilla TaxID=7936 RepID=A0A0E9XVH3_ANGAN
MVDYLTTVTDSKQRKTLAVREWWRQSYTFSRGKYLDIRENFYQNFAKICPEFETLNGHQKLPYLLGEHKNASD